jgi:NADH-quinone oxidoreductase subunit G
LPRDNESINECWLSDRDRYSYEALNSDDRLRSPMIRADGRWADTDWNTALEFAATGLRKVIDKHGAERLGALAAPTATVEEFYLLQKLVRGLGSANVDHRLRQLDFSDDGAMPMFPGLGQEIQDLEKLEAVLLVGTNIRKDQPMLAHRLRKAQLNGAHIMAINPVDYAFTYHLSRKVITNPADMVRSLARVAKALADAKEIRPAGVPAWFSALQPSEAEKQIAELLASKERTAVLLGNLAVSHPYATELRALAALVADFASATFGQLSEANSVGAWLAGCIPHRGPNGSAVSVGQDAHTMISEPLKAYLLLGVEPELDCLDGYRARQAMAVAEFVVMLTPFKPTPANTDAMKYADVLLPLAPFTETAGTFVNCEGRWQSFAAAAQPLADTRPGWKILRVLANRLHQPGFEYVNIVDVQSEIERPSVDQGIKPKSLTVPANIDGAHDGLYRIVETPIYAVDNLVRRAPSLQATADNPPPAVRMNAAQATALGLNGVGQVVVRVGDGSATLDLVIDPRVADDCVLVPAGYSQTASLAAHGEATVEKTD